jgi:c(7)-type cytochrome triheme protein
MRAIRRHSFTGCVVAMVLGIPLITSGLAQTLPRLPQDFSFPRGEGSPGQVTFSHQSHVDSKRPDCTACHPALFKILTKGTPAEGGPLGHAAMERGRQCGACHNGKSTFGLDNCALCHREG